MAYEAEKELIDYAKQALGDTYVTLVVNVTVGDSPSSGSGGGGGDDGSAVEYLVDASSKASNRAKVRREASDASGEVDFVYTGERVGGPGSVTNGFVYVDNRIDPDTPIVPGFVKQEFLLQQ